MKTKDKLIELINSEMIEIESKFSIIKSNLQTYEKENLYDILEQLREIEIYT